MSKKYPTDGFMNATKGIHFKFPAVNKTELSTNQCEEFDTINYDMFKSLSLKDNIDSFSMLDVNLFVYGLPYPSHPLATWTWQNIE